MQRQDSLHDQMVDVMKAAVEMGCYDAHDWLLRFYMGAKAPYATAEAIGATNPATPTSERLIVLRKSESVPCCCEMFCDDCPEDDDNDLAVCKGLPRS